MAVITYLNGGDLATALNAYQSAASNFSTYGAIIQMANTRTIAFTPIVETIQGAVLAIFWNSQATTQITCKLQENIAGTWTDVVGATKTLTGTQVTSGLVNLLGLNATNMQCGVYFAFPTPKLVTALANTWRFDVTVSTVAGGNPSLYTSDGTNAFFVAVGSTPVTYVNNTDQPCIVNLPVTVSTNTRLASILSTGNTIRGTCGFLGTAPTGSGSGEATSMLICTTNSITLTLNGLFPVSSWSSPRFGSSATPLTGFTLEYNSSTTGTARNTGFTTYRADADTTSTLAKSGFFLYGAVPTYEDTYLIKPALVGDTTITVADSTGWALNDRIYVGGATTRGIADTTAYTVSSVAANVITLTSAIVGSTRMVGPTCTMTIASPGVVSTTLDHGLFVGDTIYFSTTGALPTGVTAGTVYYVTSTPTIKTFQFSATLGGTAVNTSGSQSGVHTLGVSKYAGRVIRMNGYGIVFKSDVAGGVYNYMGQPSYHILSGAQIRDIGFVHSTNVGPENDYSPYSLPFRYSNLSYENTSAPTSGNGFLSTITNNYTGTYLSHCNVARAPLFGAWGMTAGQGFVASINDCINIHTGFTSGTGLSFNTGTLQIDMNRSHFESTNLQMTASFSASTFNNNRFWGCSTAIGYMRINSGINSTFYRNIFDNNANGISFVTTGVGLKSTQGIYGPTIANTTDMNLLAGYTEFEENNSPSSFVLSSPSNSVTACVIGSLIRISGYAGNSNDNRTLSRNGDTQSCGTGLADTTVRTAGGYSLRLTPNSGANLLNWPLKISERTVPTGNIQNKSMTVTAWVYINNTAYDAGVYVMPTMSVKYDNLTTVSAVATATFGSWQMLAVNFTPTTTYGQIDLWFSGATDATGTNRYFYIDDIGVNYPAGVNLDLGAMDLYASGLPIYPPIATNPSLAGVWDVQTSTSQVAGSFGKLVTDTEVKADDSTVFNLIV